jgi:PAS domain S-box-containing protein
VEADRPEVLSALSQRMLDCVGLPIAYFDRDQCFRFANAAFVDWLGKSADEVIGRSVAEVDGEDVLPLYRAYVESALEGERTGFERQLAAPGRRLWVRVDYHPPRSQWCSGVIVTYIDVDNLKRLELEAGQREHRLRLVTDSIGAPILYCDRQLKLRFANRPFGDLVGVPADDLLGHALRDAVGPDAFADLQPRAERAFAGQPESYERRAQHTTASAALGPVGCPTAIRRSGGGIFAVLTDIDDDVQIPRH